MRILMFLALMLIAGHANAQQAQPGWPVTIVETPDQAGHSADRETKSDTHDAADLDAQVRAANAAERGASAAWWQIWPTYAQALFGLASMGLLVAATYFAKKSADHAGAAVTEAKVATKAAQDAVTATRIIGEAQTRAYVSITSAQVSIVPHDGAGYGDHPFFEFVVRNSGNSPARDFRWYAQTAFHTPDNAGELMGNDDFPPPNWGVDIPAQLDQTIKSHDLPSSLLGSDLAAFTAGGLHMFVTITTVFTDVFDKEIGAQAHFTTHFPTGELGIVTPLKKSPMSAEQIAAQNAFHRQYGERGAPQA